MSTPRGKTLRTRKQSENLTVPLVVNKGNKRPVLRKPQGDPSEYVVRAILDSRGTPGKRKFLVSWAGWGSEHDTWECEKSMLQDVPQKVRAFLKRKGIESVFIRHSQSNDR